MKRSKPLSRGPSHDADGRRRYTSFDGPRAPLERSPMKRRSPKRLARRAHLDAHGEFVRQQPCCSCGREAVPRPAGHKGRWFGGIAAAHITLSRNEKSMGGKVDDIQRVALCADDPRDGHQGCHEQWDRRCGKYLGKSDDYRYGLGVLWVQATRALWECHQLETTGAPGTGEVIS